MSNNPVIKFASQPTHPLWTHFVYPSCLHAVCVCCWVHSSPHTLRHPESGRYTCRTCRAVMRRTAGRKSARDRKKRCVIFCFHVLFLCLWWVSQTDSGVFLLFFFFLPGKVVLALKLDTQVTSSSPPAQSGFPSQAWSNGMNLTERLQKKYLLSINFLTVGKRSDTSDEKRTVWVRAADRLHDSYHENATFA